MLEAVTTVLSTQIFKIDGEVQKLWYGLSQSTG